MPHLAQQQDGASVGLISLFLFEAVAASVGIRLLTASDAIASAVPALLHIGGMVHQHPTTVVNPHLEFGYTHTNSGKTVVDVAVGSEHIGKVNGYLTDRDIFAQCLITKRAIPNQTHF